MRSIAPQIGVKPPKFDAIDIHVHVPEGATLDEVRRARRIADYIAGMTDSYALGEHRRLFDATPSLR